MKRLLLLLALAAPLFGQLGTIPLPPDANSAIASTVNFEKSMSEGVTDLVSNIAPSIAPFGWMELGIFGVYALLYTLQMGTMRQLAAHHIHPYAMPVAYVAVLFRITVATLMMSCYSTPIPGLSFNFHQMFPHLANSLAASVTSDTLKEVLGYLNDAVHFLPPVGYLSVMPAIVCVTVLAFVGLSQVAMTIITAGSYAIVGILTLCGQLMIPFYVLPGGHDKKFWQWFDNMLAYSMYVFVGAGFTFIFAHAYLVFFTDLHGWSVGAWLIHIPYMVLLTLVYLWVIFKVPEVTHLLFGGIGGVGQGFANTVQGLVIAGVKMLL